MHYLELESEPSPGNAITQDVVVRHVATEAANKTRENATVVKHHRVQEGSLALVRRALNEICAKPATRITHAA